MARTHAYLALVVAAACGRAPGTPAAEPAADPTAGAIAGLVVDQDTGDPLSFATLEATEWKTNKRTVAQVTTGADGDYTIGNLPPGTYLIDVSYRSHRARFFAVPVTAGNTTSLDARLPTRELSSDASYQYVDIANNPVTYAPPREDERSAIGATSTGGIRGRVRDIASREDLPGAVVAATNPALRDAIMAIANDDGDYLMRSLPPGTYTLSVYYHLIERGNIEVRRTGVEVVAGEITEIDLHLDSKTDQ